jgi:hypothetical protein
LEQTGNEACSEEADVDTVLSVTGLELGGCPVGGENTEIRYSNQPDVQWDWQANRRRGKTPTDKKGK